MDDAEFTEILKRYVQLDDRLIGELAAELRGSSSSSDAQREASKSRVFKEIQLHVQADVLVEEAVSKYREDLYFLARRMAEDDFEPGIVTRAHVRQAQASLAKRRRRYSWGDGLLAVGGILLGLGAPEIARIGSATSQAVNGGLVMMSVVGALLLGMGIFDKAKS